MYTHFILLLMLLCANNFISKAQLLPEQDCVGAIKTCNSSFIIPSGYRGNGNVKDIPEGSNCLVNEENNSVWFYFDIDSAGELVFAIEPSLTDDYDFALYKTNDCSEIIDSSVLPIRCNYAAKLGATGLAFGSSLTNAGTTDSLFLAPLSVLPGERYYLMIDNFNNNGGGFNLNFSGSTSIINEDTTADISYTKFSSYSTPSPNCIRLNYSVSFNCLGTFADPSKYNINGPSTIIINSVSLVCDPINNTTNNIDIFYSGNFIDSADYTIDIDDSSLITNISSDLSCASKVFIPDTSVSFTAYIAKIDSFSFEIDSVLPLTTDEIVFYTIYTQPQSPYTLKISELGYIHDAPSRSIIFRNSGLKEVCAIAYNQFYADTICKTIEVVLSSNSTKNKQLENLFTVIPNPAQHQVVISAKNKVKLSAIELYNMQGKQINVDYSLQENAAILKVSHLAKGLYYAHITTLQGDIVLKKLAVH